MTVCLFVTANVGSIFEDTIRNLEPKFIALHCQEIGGKNYMTSMSYVSEFVRILLSSQELLEFEQIRVFIDEDFKANDKFTFTFFIDKLFAPVVGKEIHSGNIIDVPIIEKLKFQQNFFPECKWSRKGFIRTRWLLNGVAFDLINIHLFHDESNFVALSEFPSSYSKNRRKAFEFTLNLMKNDNSPLNDLPQFIFGDFNFRLDTQSVVQRMTNNAKPTQILSANGEISRLIYRDTQADRHLTVEKKHFMYSDPNYFTNKINIDSLREHDKELSFFDGLFELKIDFPPSYPFKEEITSSGYMNTRCPAWCDRVLMNEFAHNLLHDNANFKTKYELMGLDTPMGDHKRTN
ncbi:Type I inositol 1,4,5-trisphosphate 5-phosphatase [Tyrophagus putrescentiae]|nr:Type I inositol 1,4,5-trisphosphate 5-phosphatase [Tyrophagus putrescentiae]